MSQADPKSEVDRVNPDEDAHWLTRPVTIRRAWWIFGAVLAALVLAQLVVPLKGKFALEGSFGFGAWFGFAACTAMVLVARILGWWLKRPEAYYRDEGPAAPERGAVDD